MLAALLAVLDEHLGEDWRVTAVRRGREYIVDVDWGGGVVRTRGGTLEIAEARAAVRVGGRVAAKNSLRAEESERFVTLLKACLAHERKKRGLPAVRLVSLPPASANDSDAPEPDPP